MVSMGNLTCGMRDFRNPFAHKTWIRFHFTESIRRQIPSQDKERSFYTSEKPQSQHPCMEDSASSQGKSKDLGSINDFIESYDTVCLSALY